MIKNLYISAGFAGLGTVIYLIWLGRLSRPMPAVLNWFFKIELVIGMAFGMGSHSPSYGYLIPITFCLFFLIALALSLLIANIRRLAL
jgi:hypothetical protein